MSNEKNIEQIYDLIEQFDFDELGKEQKEFVLSEMSREDYDNMRATVADTRNLFAKYPETVVKPGKTTFTKIMKFPVEFYKVAASVIVIFGLGMLFSHLVFNDKSTAKKQIDTVFVSVIDTLLLKTTDTVQLIKQESVPENRQVAVNTDTMSKSNVYGNETYAPAKSYGISVDDLETLDKVKTKGNLSQDSNLAEFSVAVN